MGTHKNNFHKSVEYSNKIGTGKTKLNIQLGIREQNLGNSKYNKHAQSVLNLNIGTKTDQSHRTDITWAGLQHHIS